MVVATPGGRAEDNNGPPPEFQRAYKLAAEKHYDEALRILDDVLKRGENTRNALFSAGNIAMRAGEFERARNYLTRLKELEPRSGRVRVALICANQAAGNLVARDQERSELFRLRISGEDPELKNEEYFVRDDFSVTQAKITVLEFFELKGDRAVRYAFLVFRPGSNQPEYRISLGSYTATDAIWRATRKPAPKPDERLFHLDGYFANGAHVTYGMHFPEPSYDAVREMVIKAITARDGLRGQWTGSTEIPGHARLIINVDLDRTADEWIGSLSIPAQNSSGLPLEAITYRDDKFSFRIKGIPGNPTYTGVLSADGRTMEGDYTEGSDKYRFKFTRVGEPKVEVVKAGPKISEHFTGTWEGTLKFGEREYRTRLKISNGEDGSRASLISVDDGAAEIPGGVEQRGALLFVEVKPIAARLQLKLESHDSVLSGTMTHGAMDTPVKLKRVSPKN